MSEVELGFGVGLPLEVWVAMGLALGQPLAVSFSRPTLPDDLADAAHLDIQEYLLEIGQHNRRHGSFELATRPANPMHSVDVLGIDRVHRCLVIQEAWNTFGDIGASARSSSHKVAEAGQAATAHEPTPGFRVALCWIVRDTAANRAIVRRYPEVFAARFPGSSAAWAAALEQGANPPMQPGIVWFDPGRRRLRPMRLRRA